MKIFIGGSQSIKELNEFELGYLNKLMAEDAEILIGDCYGVDKLVQEYLAEKGYHKVTVFSIYEEPRVNVGKWESVYAVEKQDAKSIYWPHRNHRCKFKDFEMAEEADCGFMIWDERSKGTFINILALIAFHKEATVILNNSSQEKRVSSLTDLKSFIETEDVSSPVFWNKLSKIEQEDLLNIFMPSDPMKKHLIKNGITKKNLLNIINCSPVSIYEKKKWTELLAPKENLIAELLGFTDGRVDESNFDLSFLELMIEFVLNNSFNNSKTCYNKAIKNLKGAEGDVFLVVEYEYCDRLKKERLYEKIPFKSFEKALEYIKEDYMIDAFCDYTDSDDYPKEYRNNVGLPMKEMTFWYEIEKWESKGDELELVYTYVLFRDEILFFQDEHTGYYGEYDDRFFNSANLNLAVPFEAGDIVKIDCTPYREGTLGIVVDSGDNSDCCSLQALVRLEDGNWMIGAVKHSNIFVRGTSWLSPLYRIDYYTEELPPGFELLEDVKRFINGKKRNGKELRKRLSYKPVSSKKVNEAMYGN